MKIIVSLTSYSKRFSTLHLCLQNVFNQTFHPDKVILNLAKEDIQNIPLSVLAYQEKGLEIQCITPDLCPHNKYFHVMKQYPEDIVITLDDDVLYPLDLLEKLMMSYYKFPYAVSTGRAHNMLFDSSGNILPYNSWQHESDIYDIPSYTLFANGVGGVLYPPKCMSDELFNSKAIIELCLYADDIWLKCMQLLKQTPVVLIRQEKQHPPCILGVAEDGLYKINKNKNRNDFYLKKVFSTYQITYERMNNLLCKK